MFENMDLIIAHIHAYPSRYPNVTLRYALVDEYFSRVFSSQNQSWPSWPGDSDLLSYRKTDLADGAQFFTGYFTSRPQLKHSIVMLTNWLRGAEMMVATEAVQDSAGLLWRVKDVASRMLHHDTITGTSSNSSGLLEIWACFLFHFSHFAVKAYETEISRG